MVIGSCSIERVLIPWGFACRSVYGRKGVLIGGGMYISKCSIGGGVLVERGGCW